MVGVGNGHISVLYDSDSIQRRPPLQSAPKWGGGKMEKLFLLKR